MNLLSAWAQSNSMSMRPCGCRYNTGGDYKGVCGVRVSAVQGNGETWWVRAIPRGEVTILL